MTLCELRRETLEGRAIGPNSIALQSRFRSARLIGITPKGKSQSRFGRVIGPFQSRGNPAPVPRRTGPDRPTQVPSGGVGHAG